MHITVPIYQDDEEYWEAVERSRMSFWWPRLKRLPVPTPETVEIDITKYYSHRESMVILDREVAEVLVDAISRHGFTPPVFLRGEYSSGKFDYPQTCFLDSLEYEDILHHLAAILQDEAGNGFYSRKIYIRRYYPPETIFTVVKPVGPKKIPWFPIAKEVRVYVYNGRPRYWVRYWSINSIKHNWNNKLYILPSNWRSIWRRRYRITPIDLKILYRHSMAIASNFEGDWAIDYMKTVDARWLLIDMGDIRVSWRPEDKREYNTFPID